MPNTTTTAKAAKPELSPAAIAEIAQWLSENDHGISSETIALIALGAKRSKSNTFDAPYDPADFGRCHRLLQRVPDLKAFFPAIAKQVPTFSAILDQWDRLEALYLRDTKSGRSMELYQQIKLLRGDCDDHPVLGNLPQATKDKARATRAPKVAA